MGFVLIASIVIRLAAMVGSIVPLLRTRDWRMGFLTFMLGAMAARQIMTLLTATGSDAFSVTGHWAVELPGLVVSVMAVIAVFFLSRAVAKNKGAEDETREKEGRLRKILDGVGALVGLMTPDGTLIEANRVALEAAGLKPEDVLGKPFCETYWWSYSEEVQQQLREAIERAANGESSRYDVDIRVGENRFITIDFCLQPVVDELGTVNYLVPSAMEITERVLLREEAADRMKIEKAIGRVLREGLSSSDPTAAGQACLEVAIDITSSAFGFVGELNDRGTLDTTFLADPGWEACRIPKDQAVAQITDMEVRGVWGEVVKQNRSLITNDPFSHPASVGTPAGHPPITCFLGVPLSRGDEAFGLICVGNRVAGYTEKDRESLERVSIAFVMALDRSRAERELRKHREHLEELVEARTAELAVAKRQAETADRTKSAFLATMSHELRTPLNSIIGFTGIILQGLAGPVNREQTKQLEMVRDSGRHLLHLINEVLDISRIEAGQLEIATEPMDMRETIEKAVRTVSPSAEKKGLALVTEVAPELGQIVSDRRRVEQVLINLIDNAVKFTEEGEVRVECRAVEDRLVTRIVDTGRGIRQEDLGKLFEPFQQVDTGLARQHEGTGLGLSICKKLLEMLGGEIWAESQWGVGSTFSFALPVRKGG